LNDAVVLCPKIRLLESPAISVSEIGYPEKPDR
jgi:hypothetical protein